MKTPIAAAAWFAALTLLHAPRPALSQAAGGTLSAGCVHGAPLAGTVRDTTGATVAAAAVTLDDGYSTQSDREGRFHFACVPEAAHVLQITAESFAPLSIELAKQRVHADLLAVLQPGQVQQTVDVNDSDEVQGVDSTETGAARTLKGRDLENLAEDPDDLLRELQQLAAGAGGDPSKTIISVDGFQDSTHLPPKSSIAYIKVNPDLFSAEYGEPPYEGARV